MNEIDSIVVCSSQFHKAANDHPGWGEKGTKVEK
jgi:hypothetical protein